MRSLRLIVSVLGVVFLLTVLTPLVVFLLDASSFGGDLFSVKVINATYDGNGVEAYVAVTYKGSVPLNNFTIVISGTTINFGNIHRGTYTRKVILRSLDFSGGVQASFSIYGMYPVSVEVKPK